MKRNTLLDMLGHPLTQSAMQQLAAGVDPRLVAAQTAGNALAGQVAARLGVPLDQVKGVRAQPKNTPATGADTVDAEYTVIDVTPGVKKKVRVG